MLPDTEIIEIFFNQNPIPPDVQEAWGRIKTRLNPGTCHGCMHYLTDDDGVAVSGRYCRRCVRVQRLDLYEKES